MHSKILGIIGGMGPEATVDLMTKIIRATPAKKEQDHIRILVDNNPHIPCRVEAIMRKGESPGPIMAEMAVNLEKWGADFIVIACNTAHYYLPDVINSVKIPVLNMIEETVEKLKENGIKNAVLLTTVAVLQTKLYEKALDNSGVNLIIPSPIYQEKVAKIIAAVKSGNLIETKRDVDEIIDYCTKKGAEAIILGCTELPMAFNKICKSNIAIYDPTKIIAEAIVKRALYTMDLSAGKLNIADGKTEHAF
jgi:aspartate racemase